MMDIKIKYLYGEFLRGYKLEHTHKNNFTLVKGHSRREIMNYGINDNIITKYNTIKDPQIQALEKRLDEAFELILQLKKEIGERQ